MYEVWEDLKFALRHYPFEHAFTFVIGTGIGLFSGFSFAWWLIG